MRSSASSHRLSYRARARPQPDRVNSGYAILNAKSILALLHAVLDLDYDSPASSAGKGRKRARTGTRRGTRKRKKIVMPQPPEFEPSAPPDEAVPVLHHEFHIEYHKEASEDPRNVEYTSDDEADRDGLYSQEVALALVLKEHCAGANEPTTLDCGSVVINSCGGFGGTVDARPDQCEEKWVDLREILAVPPLRPEGAGSYSGHLFSWVDVLKNSTSHQSAVDLTCQLKVVVPPYTEWDESLRVLPFRVVVGVTLSFCPPAIFQAMPRAQKARDRNEIEGARRELLRLAFPGPSLSEPLSSSFRGRIDVPFFYSVVQPAKAITHSAVDGFLQPDALLPTLLPFQKRTVMWMLEREGKAFGPSGDIVSSDADDDPEALPVLWQRADLQRGDEQMAWYYHRLTATLTSEHPTPSFVRGGILAEEPGLGKTLECITLILLNPGIGRNPSNTWWDEDVRLNVKEIKTSLIVTPSSLSQQWVDELAQHAPTLKVLVYTGWKNVKNGSESARKFTAKASTKGKAKSMDSQFEDDPAASTTESWPAYINDFDVCITTYDTLRQDLNVARAAPIRPTRQTADYSRHKRPISPLVMCEWYRIIMDEVQMVGGGKASEMVSLIPRYSSFAVSGTPARTRVADLSYVFKFLRVHPSIYALRNWNRLMQPNYVADFVELIQRYAVRTMKLAVQNELTIPMQTRYVVPIELGKVERHLYDQNVERALQRLGLDARGMTSDNWDGDIALLRTWLRRLRQICTHPQVGQLQRFGDKASRSGVLKTMAQVLEGMVDQNWRNVMDDRRSKVNEMVDAAQMMQHNEKHNDREQSCLRILLQAEKEADELIQGVISAAAEHDAQGAKLKEEAASLRAERGKKVSLSGSANDNGGDEDVHSGIEDDEDDDPERGGLPKTLAGDEHLHKARALQQRLRECYLTLHKVKFMQGDVYHWMGEAKAEEEAAAYKAADELRSKLLKFTEESAMKAMAQLATEVGKKRLTERDTLVEVPYCPKGGILSAHLMEEADELIDELLNGQSRLLWKWRTRIHTLLTQSLTASNAEGEADGQEYSRTLDTQGEAEIYLQAYAMLLADRREVLSAERTALAAHDARERKRRKTTAAAKAVAAELDEPDPGLLTEDIELQPEHEALKQELMDARKALLEKFEGRAVKSIVVDLSGVAAKVARENDPEKIIAKEGASCLRRLMSAQATINDQIEADLALFRKAFNERILYFRQLQEISDSVREAEWGDVDVQLALQGSSTVQAELERKINTGRARQRYLKHLAESQGTGQTDEECCILCRGDFSLGYITQCAHAFCEDCMKSWLARHNKACPVCRSPINVDTVQRFSLQEKKDKDDGPAQAAPEKLTSGALPRSRRVIEYNTIGAGLLSEVESMEMRGSYGTKIDTLVRHLLYLQLADAGAKSIVFSAWEDSLHIIEHALTRNGIPCLRIDSGSRKQDAAKRFRSEPGLLVLLLHGERQNAGLNVTCASRVFLLESVVQHSFEIQAIARIDRLGQTRPTEVYCYYAEDTVERAILDLAARQGRSLYTAARARGPLDAAALAASDADAVVDAPAARRQQRGDFIFRVSDMLSILFPHLCEGPEEAAGAAAPPEDAMMVLLPDDGHDHAGERAPADEAARSSADRGRENAVAGPSRLGPLA